MMTDLSLGVWGLILLVSVWVNLIVLMRFTYKNIEIIEGYLPECRSVIDTKNLWGGGVAGRHMRLSMIFAAMWMPGIMYRRGYVTKNAHLNIPRPLRRRIWRLNIWLITNCAWAAVLYYAIESP
jgi:hypothetical protein